MEKKKIIKTYPWWSYLLVIILNVVIWHWFVAMSIAGRTPIVFFIILPCIVFFYVARWRNKEPIYWVLWGSLSLPTLLIPLIFCFMKVEEPAGRITQHKKEISHAEKRHEENSWSKPPFGRIGQIIGIIILLGVFFRMCGGPTLETQITVKPVIEQTSTLTNTQSENLNTKESGNDRVSRASPETESIQSQQKESLPPQTPLDCFESGGACLKIIQSSYRHEPIGNLDQYVIIGEVQNVGSRKNNINPWHAVEGYCYEGETVVDEGSDIPELLNPGEKAVFKISVDGHGRKVSSCRVKVIY